MSRAVQDLAEFYRESPSKIVARQRVREAAGCEGIALEISGR